MTEGKAYLVDIRETTEHAFEKISGTYHNPLSTFNPADLPAHDGKIVVYNCVTGKRTAMARPQLSAASPATCDAYHLSSGAKAWKNAGNEVN